MFVGSRAWKQALFLFTGTLPRCIICGMNKVECACEYCDSKFLRHPSQIKDKKHLYCSTDCQNRSKLIHVYTCEWCGTIYHRPVRLNQKARFCCKKCWIEWTKAQTPNNCICAVCKKPFHKYEAAKRKGEGKYCSRACKIEGTSGIGIYGGNHRTSLKGWRRARLECLNRDGHKCTKCGGNLLLHVHHKDGNKFNDELDNLLTLCNSCHVSYHWESGDYSK